MTPELLICTRTKDSEARHIALMERGREIALCGVKQQENCGAGTFSHFLRWTTCKRCRVKKGMTHHPGACWRNREDR